MFAKNSSAAAGGGAGERFLVSDISEWLDKYRLFKVEELERGTGGFDDAHLINGSVYKADIDGVVFAVKKMKWDACEELKILQKVRPPLSSPSELLASEFRLGQYDYRTFVLISIFWEKKQRNALL
jgi:hypothetical protein